LGSRRALSTLPVPPRERRTPCALAAAYGLVGGGFQGVALSYDLGARRAFRRGGFTLGLPGIDATVCKGRSSMDATLTGLLVWVDRITRVAPASHRSLSHEIPFGIWGMRLNWWRGPFQAYRSSPIGV
jgi:hypothetical protein